MCAVSCAVKNLCAVSCAVKNVLVLTGCEIQIEEKKAVKKGLLTTSICRSRICQCHLSAVREHTSMQHLNCI